MILAMAQKENKKPFQIDGIGTTVYTFEGLCHYLYKSPEAFVEAIGDGKYIEWLYGIESYKEVADNLKAYYLKSTSLLDRMLKVLSLCPLTSDKDKDIFISRYENYMSQPIHIRYRKTGDHFAAREKWKTAIAWYESSINAKVSAETYNNIGVAYMNRMMPDQAIRNFDKGLMLEDHLELRLNKIRALWVKKAYQKMMIQLSETSQIYNDSRVWYYYGMLFEKMRKIDEALTAYTRCYEESKMFKSLHALIELEVKSHGINRSIRRLEKEKDYLSKEQYFYLRSQLHKFSKDQIKREHDLEMAVRLANYPLDWSLELSSLYIEQGQLIKAIGVVGHINMKDQNKEEVIAQKAVIASSAGNVDDYDHYIADLVNQWKEAYRSGVVVKD